MKFPRIHDYVVPVLASSWAAPMLIAGMFAVAWYAPTARIMPMVMVIVAYVVAVAVAFASGLAAAAPLRSWRATLPLAGTPALLVASGFGLFLVIDVRVQRMVMAAVVLLFVSAYVSYARNVVKGVRGFSDGDFSHVSAAIHAVAVFLAYAFAMNGAEYLRAPLWASTAVVAALLMLASLETLRRAGVSGHPSFMLSAVALAVIGTELFLGATFLPIAYLAAAAVGATVFAFALHVVADVLSGRAAEIALRRQMVVTAALVMLISATARWA